MNFVYSLLFLSGFVLLFHNRIKKNSSWYYGTATIIGMLTLISGLYRIFGDLKLEGFIGELDRASRKGIYSVSIFILVMLIGAMNPKWRISKNIRKIRGELAIIASILVLPHGILYLIRFIQRFLEKMPDVTYIATVVIGLVAFVIMVPLVITSFKKFKQSMQGEKWRKLHQLSYVFYLLVYVHIMFVLLFEDHIDLLKVILFSVIFGVYAVLRLTQKLLK